MVVLPVKADVTKNRNGGLVMLLMKKSNKIKVALLVCLCLVCISIPVMAQSFVGTSGPDSITGTSGADDILGWGGNDFISAGDGNDAIAGDDGDDIIDGGGGNDTIIGGEGSDTLMGGLGDDIYYLDFSTQSGLDRIIEDISSANEFNRIIIGTNSGDVAIIQDPFYSNSIDIVFRYKSCVIRVEDFFTIPFIKQIQFNDLTLDRQGILNAVKYFR